MRRSFVVLPAVLALAACVETEMTVHVLGEDEARIAGFIEVQRQMYEMSGADASFCSPEDGGTLTLTRTHARCTIENTSSFSELMASDADPANPADVTGEIVHLGEDRVRVLLPLGQMRAGMAEIVDDPQALMMMQQMMADMSVSFTVEGREIESSTGTISDDGRRATYVITFEDLLGSDTPDLADFDTIVRF